MTAIKTGGRQSPAFLSQDGERVSVTLEPLGTHALVKLETHDWSCTLPASAFVLERIVRHQNELGIAGLGVMLEPRIR